jgi:glycerophosphoryl diester phosphodiesterase
VRRGNTLEAFRLAAALGADAVELDARRTADGVIVVHHDAMIEGRPIVAMARSEIARLAPWIPDLTDALASCAPMWVDLEIKNDPDDPDWDRDDTVLKAVARLVDDRVVVTSFNAVTTQRAHEAGMRTGQLLSWTDEPDEVLNEWPGYEFILPSKEMVPVACAHALVAMARSAGAKVGIWTIDDPAAMQAYASAGVDIVFTNVPDVARSALGG